jgi:hypothetical protein
VVFIAAAAMSVVSAIASLPIGGRPPAQPVEPLVASAAHAVPDAPSDEIVDPEDTGSGEIGAAAGSAEIADVEAPAAPRA